jgi:hypothetical protein
VGRAGGNFLYNIEPFLRATWCFATKVTLFIKSNPFKSPGQPET